jgi:hypothetical protein
MALVSESIVDTRAVCVIMKKKRKGELCYEKLRTFD